MRITSKGQVTIPQKFRKRLGLLPGTEVEFEVSQKDLIIRRASEKMGRGQRLVERMRGTATTKMSTDEIMALTRGE